MSVTNIHEFRIEKSIKDFYDTLNKYHAKCGVNIDAELEILKNVEMKGKNLIKIASEDVSEEEYMRQVSEITHALDEIKNSVSEKILKLGDLT